MERGLCAVVEVRRAGTENVQKKSLKRKAGGVVGINVSDGECSGATRCS